MCNKYIFLLIAKLNYKTTSDIDYVYTYFISTLTAVSSLREKKPQELQSVSAVNCLQFIERTHDEVK